VHIVLLLRVLALCAPSSHAVIAEVLYDAVGDDTGVEFVELYNPTAADLPLAGARLEAGDGAGAGRWSLRWTGATGDVIAAHGRFVIGGARVLPPPNAVVSLDLQNGPDAVRVTWPDGAGEVVGYGALGFAEYFCGTPAADVPSGQSLARVPDDADLGSNALDFRAAAPSPGRANQPDRDVAVVPGALALSTEQPSELEAFECTARVTNRGAQGLERGEVTVAVERGDDAGPAIGSAVLDRTLAPAETTAVRVPIAGLASGKLVLRARALLAGDEAPENDADSLRVRVGEGPLRVTEIQFHPAAGEGEWIEVQNRTHAPLDPAGFVAGDRHEAAGVPSEGAGDIAPDSLAVFAQDRAALRSHFPALDSLRVWQVRPWASLNNSDDSVHVADIVMLREADGTPCERVPYSSAGIPAGATLEWLDAGVWQPSSEPDGTPLAGPRTLPALATHLALTPRRMRGGAGASTTVAWSLPWPRATIGVELFDLAGRRVRQVLPETDVVARGERIWRPDDLPAGVYVMVLSARETGGSATLASSQPLRIEGDGR
jgi:hypothetical protein